MARSRNIKPGFFTNEDLVELDFATRLLFAGLWTVADREGRLQDRPKKIKIDVFPADDLDIDSMLSELAACGFIRRYEIDGQKIIQISNWSKHQNPHNTEKASELPAENGELTVKEPLKPVTTPKQDGGKLADSLLLIPDSLKKTGRVSRRTQIPEDFAPNETGIATAKAKGISLQDELPKFKDFHAAKGSVMLDWQAAWRTWCGNAKQFAPKFAQASPSATVQTETAAEYQARRDRERAEERAEQAAQKGPTPEQRAALKAVESAIKRVA